MDTKQGSLETKMGQGKVRIGVPIWGYTECNKIPLLGKKKQKYWFFIVFDFSDTFCFL